MPGNRRQLITWFAMAMAISSTACSQGQTSRPIAVHSMSPSPMATVATSVAPASPPTSPAQATTAPSGNYGTASDAGLAGLAAKTGYGTSAKGCPPNCPGTPLVFGNDDPSSGLNAAYVQFALQGEGSGAVCYVYVFHDSAGWHYTRPVVCPQKGGYNPVVNDTDHVNVTGGCANLRQAPSLTAKVYGCINNGSEVQIGSSYPQYRDGHIWWTVTFNGLTGFMAHDFLITDQANTAPSGNYGTASDAGLAGLAVKTGYGTSAELCPPNCPGPPQVFGNDDPTSGLNAAYVQFALQGSGSGTVCYVYVIHDSAAWHYTLPVVCPSNAGYNPVLSGTDHVNATGGCANLVQAPSLTAKVATCVNNGSEVQIGGADPRYRDGHIWWSVGFNGLVGFMAHDFLITA